MSEKKRETAIIIRKEEISYGIYDMWLRTEQIAELAKPGQFCIFILCRWQQIIAKTDQYL